MFGLTLAMARTDANPVPTAPPEVRAVFDACDTATRDGLQALRTLVLQTAAETNGVGPLTETLKWGQPAYLTAESGSGSTIRIAPTGERSDHDYAMYFICQTDLVERFRSLFGDTLTLDGDRAILFRNDDEPAVDELRTCIEMALTYHTAKR